MTVLLGGDEKKFLNLEKELKRLEGEKKRLILEGNKISKDNSDLVDEQIILQAKAKEIIEGAKKDAAKIRDNVKKIESAASEKKSAADVKLSDLNDSEKIAKDLIKSNEGSAKNLEAGKDEVNKLREKLIKIFELVRLVMEIKG